MTSNRPPAFFVGEHLALDFLNTTATPRGTRIEWLGDGIYAQSRAESRNTLLHERLSHRSFERGTISARANSSSWTSFSREW